MLIALTSIYVESVCMMFAQQTAWVTLHPPPVLSFLYVSMETIVDPYVMRWQILLEGQEMRRDDAIVEGKLFHVIGPIVDAFSWVHCVHNLDDVLVQ